MKFFDEYSDILNSPNWQKKRREILERDNNMCQRCGYSNLIKDDKIKSIHYYLLPHVIKNAIKLNNGSRSGIFSYKSTFQDKENPEKKLEYYFYSDIDNDYDSISDNMVFSMIINKRISSMSNLPFQGSSLNIQPMNHMLLNKDNCILRKNFKEQVYNNKVYIKDFEGVWVTFEQNKYLYAKTGYELQVHHKCYRKNIDPCFQNNNDYITLCNSCHKIIHASQEIPFYINNNNHVLMNCCDRCTGTGNIPIYKHIQGGVCFKCNGFGYLEDNSIIDNDFDELPF